MTEEGLEAFLRSMHEAVLLEDANRIVIFTNDAFAALFLGGAPPSVMLGVDCGMSARQSAAAFMETSAWLERTETIVNERVAVRNEPWQMIDGRWLERDYFPRIENGAFAGHAWVYRDISSRENIRRQLQDVSTELASTQHRQATETAAYDSECRASCNLVDASLAYGPVAMVLAKIVNLDRINNEAGREIGDAVLLRVPAQLNAVLPSSTVERIGGATFAVTIPGTGDAETVLRAVREGIGSTATAQGQTVLLRVSIGSAALDPARGEGDSRLLLQRARLALSEARRIGRDLSFDDELVERERRRDQLSLALPSALRDGELSLVYQPIARLSNRSVVAYESLVRWARPGFGTLTAASFVPVAEAMGLAKDLDVYIIDRAIRDAPLVLSQGGSSIGINVSSDSLRESGLIVSALERSLLAHGQSPSTFVVELTETAAADSNQVRDEMAAIAAIGVKVAMDDFGVGSSSLAMLTDTTFHYIKLDKSFTRGLQDPRVRALVTATCQLASGFEAQVIAEGVEQEEQIPMLADCGVDFGQGWVIGVPSPPPEN
jgi:diguanylate cyclase